MRETFLINGQEYLKTHALKKAKEILNGGSAYEYLKGNDFKFMVDYFKTWRSDGYYGNVRHIKIQRIPEVNNTNGNFSLLSYFNDGSSMVEGTHNGKKKSSEVNAAFRIAIRNQIVGYRNLFFIINDTPCCELCGETLEEEDCHIDHYSLEFKDIISTFMEMSKLTYSDIELVHESEPIHCVKLKDKNLEAKFIEYHNANTRLRAIHNHENLRR